MCKLISVDIQDFWWMCEIQVKNTCTLCEKAWQITVVIDADSEIHSFNLQYFKLIFSFKVAEYDFYM